MQKYVNPGTDFGFKKLFGESHGNPNPRWMTIDMITEIHSTTWHTDNADNAEGQD